MESQLSIDNEEESSLFPVNSDSADQIKTCWVCYSTSEDRDYDTGWVKPCLCSGSTKWVHQMCLQKWIDEKQKHNSNSKVSCSQCKFEYIIIFPSSGFLVQILEFFDRMIYTISPFTLGTILLGSVYWLALSYGTITVLQVYGHEEGKQAIEQADALSLLVGLPSIPIFLALGKQIHWENMVLKFWRRCRLTSFYKFIHGETAVRTWEPLEPYLANKDDPISASRTFIGALLLPTFATMVGKFLFSGTSSKLRQSLYGGITFVLVKGIFKIYLKQQQYLRHLDRRVSNYPGDTKDSSD